MYRNQMKWSWMRGTVFNLTRKRPYVMFISSQCATWMKVMTTGKSTQHKIRNTDRELNYSRKHPTMQDTKRGPRNNLVSLLHEQGLVPTSVCMQFAILKSQRAKLFTYVSRLQFMSCFIAFSNVFQRNTRSVRLRPKICNSKDNLAFSNFVTDNENS